MFVWPQTRDGKNNYELKMNVRTGDVDLKELGARVGTVEEDNDAMFKCGCGNACEDRIHICWTVSSSVKSKQF